MEKYLHSFRMIRMIGNGTFHNQKISEDGQPPWSLPVWLTVGQFFSLFLAQDLRDYGFSQDELIQFSICRTQLQLFFATIACNVKRLIRHGVL
ncbi:hypothetical protein [Candidatus Kuenenia stuttgartiensis]|uniref:hypothetical protein n=1 Tax=Kuenenia stuttgartiensis TaxID=174633 RepID=UPI0013EB642B|nr:hypothetical protein [Candidatus Kuenenia stuttgartiensis]